MEYVYTKLSNAIAYTESKQSSYECFAFLARVCTNKNEDKRVVLFIISYAMVYIVN